MPNNCSKFIALVAIVVASSALAAEAPTLLARDAWKAKPPLGQMTPQKPTAILIHHTGSPMKAKATLQSKMQGLQRFSQAKEKLADGRTKPAWPDVPYHFYIATNGEVAEGRDISAVGDTNTGYDPTGYIQVVVEGNFDTETLTDAQLVSLTSILKWLTEKYAIAPASVLTHKDKAQTACPGKDLAAKLPAIIESLK